MTGSSFERFFTGKILGMLRLATALADPLLAEVRRIAQDIFGAGGVIGSVPTATVSGAEVTFTSDRGAWTPSGYRLVVDAGQPEWTDIPFANSGATAYTWGARHCDVPTGAERGADGGYGFRALTERVGRIETPATVTADAAGLILTMTANLQTGEKWPLGAGHTRPVVVWYETASGRPRTASSQAVYSGSMIDDGTDYRVEVPHRFGGAFDATAARYKVAILGPEPAVAARVGQTIWINNYVVLGSVASGVFSTTGVSVLGALGTLAAAFAAEHNPTTGAHTDIGADSYAFNTAPEYVRYLTPQFGGFWPQSGSPAFDQNGLVSAVDATLVSVWFPLDLGPRQTGEAAGWTVTDLGVNVFLDGTGGTITATLYALDADADAGAVAVGTPVVASTVTGSWETETQSQGGGVALDPVKSYGVLLTVEPDALATDCAVAHVIVTATRSRLE